MASIKNEIPAASKYFLESLAINLEVGDERAMSACLAGLAALAIRKDQQVETASPYGLVESRLESLSVNLLSPDQVELGRF